MQLDSGKVLSFRVSDWISKELRRLGGLWSSRLKPNKENRGNTKKFEGKDMQSTVYYKNKKLEITSEMIQQGNIAL